MQALFGLRNKEGVTGAEPYRITFSLNLSLAQPSLNRLHIPIANNKHVALPPRLLRGPRLLDSPPPPPGAARVFVAGGGGGTHPKGELVSLLEALALELEEGEVVLHPRHEPLVELLVHRQRLGDRRRGRRRKGSAGQRGSWSFPEAQRPHDVDTGWGWVKCRGTMNKNRGMLPWGSLGPRETGGILCERQRQLLAGQWQVGSKPLPPIPRVV